MSTPGSNFSGWHLDRGNSRLDFYYGGTRIGHINASGLFVNGTQTVANVINNDVILGFGTTSQVAIVERSTVLNANTALTGVIVGTPVTPAVAADSLIIGNKTADGDIMLVTQTGGNSHAAMWVDASAAITRFYSGAGVEVLKLDSAAVSVTGTLDASGVLTGATHVVSTSGQVKHGAVSDGSTPGISVAGFKTGTPPVGAATTTSKIYASSTVMRKIIADGTDSAVG